MSLRVSVYGVPQPARRVNNRTVNSGWLWAGLLFGSAPTAVFALGVAILVFVAKCVVYVIAALVVAFLWLRGTYFR